ncbi:MAG: adenylate/guanylate cyclase domain-containing protein [Chitinophagaceae bacterium]
MRRLSAIMFTDMVGYSAITQKNEALALDLLEEHRKILRPFFEKHDGREIGTAGDSFFVEFKSAVESTNCAIEIQTTLNERNKTEPPERQILLRIGLHIGDVIFAGEQVQGDGVNIAARMEPLAQPGGICISEDVARQIRNKISYPVIKLGNERLKNISMPMDIYCIALPWLQPGKRVKRDFSVKKIIPYIFGLLAVLIIIAGLYFIKNYKVNNSSHSKLRLAVLPLSNISNDAKDEYFADGMTEELISSLSKIGGLNVIARTSIMKYKTSDKDISKIGQELMVGSILEGSVRKFENKARVTVQLIDVATQEHLWSMDYDRELKDIFMIQSEIAQKVAGELKVRLVSSEKEQLEKGNTNDMVAFQEYLIGKHFLNQRTSESIQTSLQHFEKSIQQDSAFALPYASLAYAYTLIGVAGYGNISRDTAVIKAKEAVMKSLAIDETLAEAHAALGYIKFRIDWDWKAAEKELKRAIELKPSYATAHEWYALFLAIHVRLDEALREMQNASELDPLSPSVSTGIARIYHFRNETSKGLAQIKKTLELDPNYAEAHFTAGMTYFKIKDYKNAASALEKAVRLSGRRPVMLGFLGTIYGKIGKTGEMKKLLAELETAPVTNDKLYATLSIKSSLGQTNEVLDIMEKLLADRYGIMIYSKVEKDFFAVGSSPRYQQILVKMGFE